MAIALMFLASSNAHLVVFPFTTAAFHYLYTQNHLKKLTLYYDMQKLGKDENYTATFDAVKKVLMEDERMKIYIEQSITDSAVRDRTLIFEHPIF